MLVRLLLVLVSLAASCAFAQSWQPLSPGGGRIQTLVGEPGDGHAYAIAFNALFLSSDAGRTWRLPAQRIGGMPSQLAIQASNPARVFQVDEGLRLLRSDDYGDTWTATGHVTERLVNVLALPTGAVVYVAGTSVRRSTDGGVTFSTPQGLPGNAIITLVVNPFLPTQLIAGAGFTPGGAATLYRSNDSGATWSPLFTPSPTGQALSVVFLSATRYAASIGDRIYASNDNGATWTPVREFPSARLARLAQSDELLATDGITCLRSADLFVTTQNCAAGLPPPLAAAPISSLAVVRDGNGAERVLANPFGHGVFALDAGGTAWVRSDQQLYGQAMRGLALSPRDPAWIVAGRSLANLVTPSLMTTRDGGASWQQDLGGRLSTVTSLVFDPTTDLGGSTRLYAAGTGTAASPSGVLRSDDGGASWITLNGGVSGTLPVVAIALDPRACATPPPAGPCTIGPLYKVFALTRGANAFRVMRSVQSGQNWVPVGAGLPALSTGEFTETAYPNDIAFDANGTRIYLSTSLEFSRSDGAPHTPSSRNGVFRSADDGQTWVNMPTGLPLYSGTAATVRDIHAIAAHPRRSGVLYASTVQPGEDSRIYKSVDGAENWTAAGAALTDCDVRDLQIDPAAPDVVIAAGLSRSRGAGCLWRSENGGATWTPLNTNLPVSQVLTVRQSPQDARRLVIASDVGIWTALVPSDRIFAYGFD